MIDAFGTSAARALGRAAIRGAMDRMAGGTAAFQRRPCRRHSRHTTSGGARRHRPCSPLVDGQRVCVFARKGEQEVTRRRSRHRLDAVGRGMRSAVHDELRLPATASPEVDAGARWRPPVHPQHHRRPERPRRDRQGAWRHAFDKEFGPPPDFGTAMSPIVDNGLVIAHVGGINGGALRAFDPATGATGGAGPGRTRLHSWPGGRRVQIVTENSGLRCGRRSGALLWSLPLTTPTSRTRSRRPS